jgi:hypothetical protein
MTTHGMSSCVIIFIETEAYMHAVPRRIRMSSECVKRRKKRRTKHGAASASSNQSDEIQYKNLTNRVKND